MRWRDLRRSSNVEDQRGRGAGRGLRLPIGGKGGLGLILLLVVAYFLGGPELVMSLLGGGDAPVTRSTSAERQTYTPSSGSDEAGELASAILASTEDVWDSIFAGSGNRYVPPRLVLFSDAVQSACGYNTSATGPFYCPPDRQLYLDTGFFRDLARMGGAGDFAQAYVIGHEVGHHVQNLVGTASKVRQLQQGSDQRAANRLQVAMELQADCYAGVWAFHANRTHALLEPGDIEEGLAAAAAIGDDRLQKSAGRSVSPESFTHGSSAERQRWLEVGLTTGDVDACDTFARR